MSRPQKGSLPQRGIGLTVRPKKRKALKASDLVFRSADSDSFAPASTQISSPLSYITITIKADGGRFVMMAITSKVNGVG